MRKWVLLTWLLAGCAASGDESVAQALAGPVTYDVAHSNVAELDGVHVTVRAEPVDGMTAVTISPVAAWPIQNAFLGFDKFFYNASLVDHPIVRVVDGQCDEVAVDGRACGWRLNYGTCHADGFGCFASLASADPAGHGALLDPLVFYLAGDADLAGNALGGHVALHGRFGEAPGSSLGCSGWFSDGMNAGAPGSDPGCVPYEAERACMLSVEPTALYIAAGHTGQAVIHVGVRGFEASPPVMLTILPSPTPPGLGFTLQPNPVEPPGDSTLRVSVAEGLGAGPRTLTLHGEVAVPGAPAIACETRLDIEVAPRPPSLCGCD